MTSAQPPPTNSHTQNQWDQIHPGRGQPNRRNPSQTNTPCNNHGHGNLPSSQQPQPRQIARHHDNGPLPRAESSGNCPCGNNLGISRNLIHGSLRQFNRHTDSSGHCSKLKLGALSLSGTPSRTQGTTSLVIQRRNARFSA